MKNFDVIIVGAGNGGLMAAAYACKNGLKTLLLEKHNLPGGSATSFRRGRFEFEASLHEMAEVGTEENPGIARKIFEEVGADVKFIREETAYRVVSTKENLSFDATFPCDTEGFCDEIERQVPGSRPSVRKYFDIIEEAVATTGKLTSLKIKPSDLPKILDVFRLVSHTSDEVMDLCGIPKKAQHMMTIYWPYIGEPTDRLDAFFMGVIDNVYLKEGAAIPSMFSHEFSLALESIIRKNGGEIWYNSPVTNILVKNHKAYGVVVEKGSAGLPSNKEEIHSDYVICNCFPNDVFGKMMDKAEVPLIERKRINAREIALSFVIAYVGLNKSAEELGIKDYTIFMLSDPDSAVQYNDSFGLGAKGWETANCLNVAIPECTPEGTCQMCFTTAVYGDEWGKIAPEDYKKTKMEVAEKMIDFYEKTMGISIKPYIEEIEVATPVTFSRYLNTPNGTPYGYQTHMWDGTFMRTMNVKKEHSIKNLRFCGAHTEGSLGYNMTYHSGRNAVMEILKKKGKVRK
ncbi:MAG: NAD(P)/FAD-dependent oxidoreductase [Treponema sp.]|nr:NAD(P)/FAD-dependent oxidoreductase [Treponema sp.]